MNKPLVPLTLRQMKMITSNVVKCVKNADTTFLTKQAYNFLYLSSGFIAHYNLYGFQDEYAGGHALAVAIMKNKPNNQWNNFRPGERDYDYMMAKKMCYNMICAELEKLGYTAPTDRWGW
jgi:hypothetical protein